MSQLEMSTSASSSFAYSSNLAYSLNASTIESGDSCIIDLGTPNHMIGLSSLFSSYKLCTCRVKVRIANGSLSPMSSKGSIFVREKYIISPCGWPNLQIAPSGIKVNSNVLMVCLIYKSLLGLKFR
jgi:hypothetical protein